MSHIRIAALTSLTMVAFASNSILCRIALKNTTIDAASFTTVRIVSGALMLALLARLCCPDQKGRGNWLSASALFLYAAGFSFAYVSLPAATGALLLFVAVQTTMIGYAIWVGERLTGMQMVGIIIALGGLIGLLLPGISSAPLFGSILMLSAGTAWGVYSLRGTGSGEPTKVTAGNFLRAAPLAAVVSVLLLKNSTLDYTGIGYAVLSGSLASGMGYVLWYKVLPALKTTSAATVQLSVPVIAALGGIVFLGEHISFRFILSSLAILGGIAMVISGKQTGNASEVPLSK